MIVLTIFLACDDHKFTGGHASSVEVEGNNYEAVQAILDDNSCTACHAGGLAPNLTDDLCTSAVDVSSSQLSSMLFIEVGSAENSYLYHKIAGTHMDVGGTGDSMPPGGAVSAEHLAILESWINSGASCELGSEDTGTDPDTGL